MMKRFSATRRSGVVVACLAAVLTVASPATLAAAQDSTSQERAAKDTAVVPTPPSEDNPPPDADDGNEHNGENGEGQSPFERAEELRKAATRAERQVAELEGSYEEQVSLVAQLGAIQANQETEVSLAVQDAETAKTQLDAAKIEEDEAQVLADELDEQVREAAVNAYVGGARSDDLLVLNAQDATEAGQITTFLTHEAERRNTLLDDQLEAHEKLETLTEQRSKIAVEADEAKAHHSELLLDVKKTVTQQQTVVANIESELDVANEEAKKIASENVEVAVEINTIKAQLNAIDQAKKAAARARMLAAAKPKPVIVAPPIEVPVAPKPTVPDTTTTTPAPQPTTPPRPPTPSGTISITRVGGIVVNSEIAQQFANLLSAARADGVILKGWGYRSNQRQIELRIAHCGPTYYDIWLKPSGRCSPPTATPGRSMHEQGLAIDFTCDGASIGRRSSPCFQWLAANAHKYGLYNLPSEPWHWSVNGN